MQAVEEQEKASTAFFEGQLLNRNCYSDYNTKSLAYLPALTFKSNGSKWILGR